METPQAENSNGDAQIITPEAELFNITASEAAKKFGVHNSTIYYWAKRGLVRRQGKRFIEAELVARVTSPDYAKNHATTLAGHAKRKPKRGDVNTPPAVPRMPRGPDLAHHIAYVAGYTDAYLDHYARGNAIDSLALRTGLAEVLRAKL